MMNYRRHRRITFGRGALVLGGLFILFFILPQGWGGFVNIREMALSLRGIFLADTDSATLSFSALIRSRENLIKENALLKEELIRMSTLHFTNQKLKAENEDLRARLGRVGEGKHFITARVISRPPKTFYDVLLLDVGQREGISGGERVFSYENIVLGEVAETSGNYSKVMLYSSPGVERDALIGPEKFGGKAVGLGGGNYKIILPKDLTISSDDEIITPDGALLGVVREIEAKPQDAFQEILFKTPVNIQDITFVDVAL